MWLKFEIGEVILYKYLPLGQQSFSEDANFESF